MTPLFKTPTDEILDFLLSSPTPEQVIDMRPTTDLQERVSYLLESNRQGMLTLEEREELDDYGRLEHFIRRLKIRAQEKLMEKA